MIGKACGVFLLTFLAGVRGWQFAHGSWLAGFLLAQAGIAVWLLVGRREAEVEAGWLAQAAAWASAALPLAMAGQGCSLLPVPGLILSIWASMALGASFAIAPADRGLARRGPYRWLRHPMYTGELLSLLGTLAAAWSVWNALLLTAFTAAVVWRIGVEEGVIAGYDEYAGRVRWRLLPGVW